METPDAGRDSGTWDAGDGGIWLMDTVGMVYVRPSQHEPLQASALDATAGAAGLSLLIACGLVLLFKRSA